MTDRQQKSRGPLFGAPESLGGDIAIALAAVIVLLTMVLLAILL
ncbi:hypothetical protein SAMN05444695_104241 [Rhodococcus triatomae]|uniref:Uncharacterized protein n=1 Tax=Rhodococcus triatomae TaxID=300028 RepID=A0A1G8GY03_9NOCA|nr:hypothetical protein [Rhodococcus triatomae]SDH99234.1 hypothetical protein SAMN05444695_104241 [Rhodococcus triatomae]